MMLFLNTSSPSEAIDGPRLLSLIGRMNNLKAITICLLLTGIFLGACVKQPTGPRIRVATATLAELQSASKESSVWYEFQAGDVIPVQFGFLGDVEGGSDGKSVLRAKKPFYFVTSKNGPIRLSFDGKTLAGENTNQSVIAVVPHKSGVGGELVWMVYMGAQGTPEAELDSLMERAAVASE